MSWKRVCKAADVPEDSLKKFEVDGIEIVIAHYGGGFRAIPPVCPHMQEPFEESGVIDDCVLTCTKHLWAWHLGSLERRGEAERSLKTYQVRQEDGDILAFADRELLYEFEDEDDMDEDAFFGNG